MANTVIKLIDSQRKVVFRVTANTSELVRIDAGSLAFALNANGKILTGSDRKSKYRLGLKKIFYDVITGHAYGSGPGVRIMWDNAGANLDNTIITCSGSGSHAFNEGGEPFVINEPTTGQVNGNIIITTTNTGTFGSNGMYTLIMDFRKNPEDYDQGQTADPIAFNRGRAAGPGIS